MARRPHRHERQAAGRQAGSATVDKLRVPESANGDIESTGDPRQEAMTLPERDAALPDDVTTPPENVELSRAEVETSDRP